MPFYKPFLFAISFCLVATCLFAQAAQANMSFVVSMEDPATHNYHVVLTCTHIQKQTTDLHMCAWTPGYYELLDYAKAVNNFRVTGTNGKDIAWDKPSTNTWRVHNDSNTTVVVTYDVHAVVSFVGNVYLNETHGYITPGGLFLYMDEELHNPVTVQVKPYSGWKDIVATGLNSLPHQHHTFYAANFDILYDSPLLVGNLDVLPPFTIQGVPHYYVGYDLGEFDRLQFVNDLRKVIAAGISIIGDIPYKHYTFLVIGQGGGGIEHLNTSSISFKNKTFLQTPEGRKTFYSFLVHEYFHHYNVKRIRPIELGPFNYTKENVTNMLWVSEGFTSYYEYLMVKMAGIVSGEEVLKAFQSHIRAYENKPGHLLQSATQASRDTWTEPPFGRTGEDLYKTISYYDKGCILGLMIDLKIRHETMNQHSLDDVMRALYKDYYQIKQRGFTEQEFQQECEKIAGTSLQEVFEYATTVKPVNYPKYFAYAGLTIDTVLKALPGAYTGMTVAQRDSNLVAAEVVWGSPAWNAGIRDKDTIRLLNENTASLAEWNRLLATKMIGDSIALHIAGGNTTRAIFLRLETKEEKSFAIQPMSYPDALQKAIYTSWMRAEQ